jgi:hypothetical protein
MPTYHPSPPSPTPTTPSFSSASDSSRFPTRSHSFSTSSTPSSSRSSKSSRLNKDKDDPADAKKKIPYFFLGSIAAASLVAHKCWPKGFPQGDKEDWELSELGLRAKYRRLAEKAEKVEREAARRGRRGSASGYGYGYGFDGPMGSKGGADGYREGVHGRRGGYYVGEREEEYGYNRDGRGWGWEHEQERGRERRGSVAHGRSRSRDYDFYRPGAYMEPPHRRAVSRERTELVTETERYYPPAPKRYLLEQSAPTTGSSGATRSFIERSSSNAGLSAGPRFSTSSQRESYYDYGRALPSEAVYVYRDPPPARSRRVSFDAGGVGRYDGGHDWYFR